MTARIGSYVGDTTGVIWVECPRHGVMDTASERIAERLLAVHDLCPSTDDRRPEGETQ